MAERSPRDQRGFLRRPRILDYIGAGGIEDEEARKLAEEFVRRARAEDGRFIEGPAPDRDAVRERREAIQHRDV